MGVSARVLALESDGKMDVSNTGEVSRLEVLEGPSGRRRRSRGERARIAAESLMPRSHESPLIIVWLNPNRQMTRGNPPVQGVPLPSWVSVVLGPCCAACGEGS